MAEKRSIHIGNEWWWTLINLSGTLRAKGTGENDNNKGGTDK
jgi:hypothetical protein